MIGGTIIDYYQVRDSIEPGSRVLKFLVRGTDCEANDYCCVKATIPLVVYPELSPGQQIWWNADYVYLKIYGVQDAKFSKIGFSGGDAKSFYEKMPKGVLPKPAKKIVD